MKTYYIADLLKGMTLDGEYFAVVEAEKGLTKDQKPYMKLVLGDKTGQIRGQVWSDKLERCERGSLVPGKVVAIEALVEEFKGSLQLNIAATSKVEESYLEEFIEGSDFPLDELWQELEKHLAQVKDEEITAVLQKLIHDEEIQPRLKTYPAAEFVHHAFQGGLLEHYVEMLDIVQPFRKYYPEADFDLVIAGIIFHDIGKLYELEKVGVAVKRSREGYLLGHLAKSYEILLRFAADLPAKVMLNLKHIVLAHHGNLEFGSPVVPATLEAVIVHVVDVASSQTRIFQKIIRKNIKTSTEFAEYDKILGTRVYTGNYITEAPKQETPF